MLPAKTWLARRGTAAGKAKPVYFSNNGVARHFAKLLSDLRGAKAIGPKLFQKVNAGGIPAKTVARRRAGA